MRKERKNFVEALATESKKTKMFTENMAIAYETSGKELLDFNFRLTQYRNSSEKQIYDDFTKVFYEDPAVAVKFVFYVGDVREGLGERKIFRTCMDWLADQKPEIALEVLDLVPEYTRWDNLVRMIAHPKMGERVLDIIVVQLKMDIASMYMNKPISLCAKWLPSENASSAETKQRAKMVREGLKISPRDYRKTLSALRAYLDVTEVKTSANRWKEIKYESVPSQANLKYNAAFFKHDKERREAYLESLKKGETKINASVAQPHEIVSRYGTYWNLKDYDETLEQMWKALPNLTVENTLVVRDGSGSMTCSASGNISCLDVATALAIYCAEHNSPEWTDKFVTFSARPKFVDMSNCKSLRDKVRLCHKYSDCSNTNIEATMRLILNTAKQNNCSQEDMPKNILIISDMQFDAYSYSFNWNRSLFEEIAVEYTEAGYKLPRIIFWNVSSRYNLGATVPMQNNELGLVLCSGFSINNMKMFMSGEINPYKILLDQINKPRYDAVEQRIKDVI